LAFLLLLIKQMTKQLQADLSELEKLKGIRIVMADDEQSFFIGFSYEQRTRGEKAFAWMCWTAVAILYGVCGLVLWWAMMRA
jgi:hypothetical protein